MRYLHPDVLDNGPAYIRANALQALVIPFFTNNYEEAVASSLISVAISNFDFVISDEGDGRKIVSSRVSGPAINGVAFSPNIHVIYTDGTSRILWAEGIKPTVILRGQNYRLPSFTCVFSQPESIANIND